MQIERKEVLELLTNAPLFSYLETPLLDWLSSLFQFEVFHDGEIIFAEGDPSEVMYLVYDGAVVCASTEDHQLCKNFQLGRGDIFGEQALLFDDPRDYQAVALGDTILLRWTATSYLEHHLHLPGLEERLEVIVESRKLSAKVDLPWLQLNEYVNVISRRHPVVIFKKLLLPLLMGSLSLSLAALLQWRWFPEQSYGWILGAISILVALGWVIWDVIDWRNDYFIITNKRVVWIEKVALIYESRQEAPLRTIMSVGLQRSRIGSLLKFADVIVMTYVGTIRFQFLRHAEAIASLVEAYWHTSKSHNQREEARAMAQMLHEKIDLPLAEEEQRWVTENASREHQSLGAEKEPGFLAWLFSDFIRLRYEKDGVITYRKHWFVLIKKTWLPLVLTLLSLVGLAAQASGRMTLLSMNTGMTFFVILLSVLLIWIVYQYADWRNDQFQVTFEQIIDLDRKPLGKVRRRSAPLENVLSIEYKRLGFWGFLFNFGTVYITVGSTKLTFDHVYHPSEVQQDIFYRMGERLESVRQFEIDSERERVSEWIASYHRKMNELNRQSGTGSTQPGDTTKRI
jgi:CRP-like cAMP-binding protein